MIEVTKEQFQSIISTRPYSTSFVLGEYNTTRYNGKKGLFKGCMFAKITTEQDGKKYYVDKCFESKL